MNRRWLAYIGLGIVAVVLILWLVRDEIEKQFFKPTESSIPSGVNNESDSEDIVTLAEELKVPWSVVQLPSGDLLVTERPGTLKRIGQNKKTYTISGVQHTAEGGLLGMALDPKFLTNSRIYLYLTTKTGNTIHNRVESYKYSDDQLTDRKVVLDNIPGANFHDGGRIAFGPDGFLYVTTGDATERPLAQDKNSLAGKILRMTTDGKPAPGNPFSNYTYSYGHRNPQGLAWDEEGQLWSTEHGRSGTSSGFDELNLIKPGLNYGWPTIEGDQEQPGMEKPVANSGANETWAPASLAYAEGSLFFAGLRGETLYEAKLSPNNSVKLTAHFRGEYGRLREVFTRGNYLYLSTSNTDGRGEPKAGDDKLFKINLGLFK